MRSSARGWLRRPQPGSSKPCWTSIRTRAAWPAGAARRRLHLEQEVRGAAGTGATTAPLTGRVRVACLRSIGTDRLELVAALRERRADIAIAQLTVGRGFLVQPYVHDDYVLVAPQALPLAGPLAWD